MITVARIVMHAGGETSVVDPNGRHEVCTPTVRHPQIHYLASAGIPVAVPDAHQVVSARDVLILFQVH